ncbi:Protein of unknown function [Cotesia congregata]|uniref:Uncharacterized protein n=1 Tax=Cotesia congregata TaxID=51543 RepID=A0A8J2H7P2_COTCN|nr:Protein of unknown function [Cotesia congregata]
MSGGMRTTCRGTRRRCASVSRASRWFYFYCSPGSAGRGCCRLAASETLLGARPDLLWNYWSCRSPGCRLVAAEACVGLLHLAGLCRALRFGLIFLIQIPVLFASSLILRLLGFLLEGCCSGRMTAGNDSTTGIFHPVGFLWGLTLTGRI